ncbi:MAG: hypothetical protein WCC52_07535 [Nitrosotalea sp.]
MRALLLVLVIGSVLALSTGNSFAQTAGPSQQSVLGIYAQIEVQDSSGNLVAYIETPRITIYHPDQLNGLINANIGMFDRNIVNVGGQNLEILQVNDTLVHQSSTIVSLNLISANTPNGQVALAAADHDGYPVVSGDKVTTYWTIIRSAS